MRPIGVSTYVALTAVIIWSQPLVPSAGQTPVQPIAPATTVMVDVDGVAIAQWGSAGA